MIFDQSVLLWVDLFTLNLQSDRYEREDTSRLR